MLYPEKNNSRLLRWISTIAVLGLIYVFSYPAVLPLMEKLDMGRWAYLVYGPVETLRNHNSLFWRYSEVCYKKLGGTTEPLSRSFFPDSPRREININNHGVLIYDILGFDGRSRFGPRILYGKVWYSSGALWSQIIGYENGNIKKCTRWYESGVLSSEFDGYMNGLCKTRVAFDEAGKIEERSEFDESGKGVMHFYDNGKEVATTYCDKDDEPGDGTLLMPLQKENGFWVRYIYTYKGGAVVEKKIYKSEPIK